MMKRKILSFLFATVMLTVLFGTVTAFAEVTSGICGDNLTWVWADDGTLTITGSGDMYDNSYLPKGSSFKVVTNVVLGDGITSICDWAFDGCGGASITIPDSVTSIGAYAFYGCGELTSVTIPDSVTSIGGCAFANCGSLTSITIGKNVTSIGDSAFQNCYNLTEINWNAKNVADFNQDNYLFDRAGLHKDGIDVVFGETVEKIPAYVFHPYGSNSDRKPKIKNVIIGDSVKSIGDRAFYRCSELSSVIIGNGVTNIGESVFDCCHALTDLTLGNSIKTIGEGAFFYCTGLTSIIIPDSVTSISEGAFADCLGLTNLTLGNSVTSIGKGAFSTCEKLTSLTIPDSVTSIGDSAFSRCSALTSLTIPDSVTSIGSDAFNGCNLTTITLPDSVTSFGKRVFLGYDTTDVYYGGSEDQWNEIKDNLGIENSANIHFAKESEPKEENKQTSKPKDEIKEENKQKLTPLRVPRQVTGKVAAYDDEPMTRALFCAKAVEAFDLSAESSAQSTFSDVNPTHTYYEEIMIMTEKGYMTGYTDGMFGPDDKISRASVATILVRMMLENEASKLPPSDDASASAWYGPYTAYIKSEGIMPDIDNWDDYARVGDVVQFRTGKTTTDNGEAKKEDSQLKPEEKDETKGNDDIAVLVNGNKVVFDQQPFIENGRTLVPLRAIFEALDALVEWDDATKTVTATNGVTTIKLTIGSNEMQVGEEIKFLDVPAKITGGRTMVPVRAISEAFKCTVEWIQESRTVVVSK